MSMPFSSFNSIIATSSGMIGGVTKAVSSGFTYSDFAVPQIAEVSFYAAVSAIVGYLVKLSIDQLIKKIKKLNNNCR